MVVKLQFRDRYWQTFKRSKDILAFLENINPPSPNRGNAFPKKKDARIEAIAVARSLQEIRMTFQFGFSVSKFTVMLLILPENFGCLLEFL